MSAKMIDKIPGVTSFSRRSIISDAVFFNIAEHSESPLRVVRHGIRGTQNINSGDKTTTRDPSQIQVTETARTEPESDGFIVRFSLRYLPLEGALHACTVSKEGDRDLITALREQFGTFVTASKNSEGLAEVARRTARNILNGRWLWRNRSLGESILINVTSAATVSGDVSGDELQIKNFDGLSLPLNVFADYTTEEIRLASHIQSALEGKGSAPITVEAHVKFGFTGSVEVYPSQNYVSNKPKGFARPLYKIGAADKREHASTNDLLAFNDIRRMGQAAIRDQKIGNALRTIDTWYDEAEENNHLPIAVEPEGANLEFMRYYRKHAGYKSNSSFALAARMGELDPNSHEGMFLIAALMRGGVYGEVSK